MVLYLFQASYSKYCQHKSKPVDLFEKKKDGQSMSIYDKICAKLNRNPDQNKDAFSKYDFYIYLHPTDASIRQSKSTFSTESETSSFSELFNTKSKKRKSNSSGVGSRSSSRLEAKESTPMQSPSQAINSEK